jgi:hypothetical protein
VNQPEPQMIWEFPLPRNSEVPNNLDQYWFKFLPLGLEPHTPVVLWQMQPVPQPPGAQGCFINNMPRWPTT